MKDEVDFFPADKHQMFLQSDTIILGVCEQTMPKLLKIRSLQPAYKQAALGWQIFKQLPGLNPLSLSNNKNYRLKKSGDFPL